MATYPPRNKVEKKYTWNAESVFKSKKAWEEELKSIVADLESIKKFQGHLGDSPASLLEASKRPNRSSNAPYMFLFTPAFPTQWIPPIRKPQGCRAELRPCLVRLLLRLLL